MMEVKIDIESYLTEEDIKQIVEDEVREHVIDLVKEYFKINRYEDFVKNVALGAYWQAVDELGEDTLGKVRRQVRKLIPKISEYSLIGTHYCNGKDVPTRLQQIIDEESEKMRPEIAELVRNTAKRRVDAEAAVRISDAVYCMLIDALGGQ